MTGPGLSAKEQREAQKNLSRLERRIDKLAAQEADLHTAMAAAASDYAELADLDAALKSLRAERESVELEWLTLAERLGA